MKANSQSRTQDFPLRGMTYKDRLQLTIKEFGRKVVIRWNRGVDVQYSEDKRTITITYPDSPTRKAG